MSPYRETAKVVAPPYKHPFWVRVRRLFLRMWIWSSYWAPQLWLEHPFNTIRYKRRNRQIYLMLRNNSLYIGNTRMYPYNETRTAYYKPAGHTKRYREE